MDFFIADGIRLAYQVDGPTDAPPLVLANSLGTTLHMWDPQVARLKQQLHIIRYDSRGHGNSERANTPYTIQDLGNDLLVLLDTLQIERAHICGLSLGGMVAQWFAIHHPDRTISVVLADTAARIGTEQTWDARIAAIKTGGMSAIRDAILGRFLSEGYRQRHPETVQEIEAMLAAADPLGYIATCEALRAADLRDLVHTISAPSLILVGELDESTPPAQARELHAAIAGSEFFIFDGVAHLANRERPEEFSQLLLDFVTRHSA